MDGNRFLAPLLIKELPPTLNAPRNWCDATTPYGYPTPLLQSSAGAVPLKSMLTAFRQVAVDHGIITAFFRLHPLLHFASKEALADHGTLVTHGQTVYINLRESVEKIDSQLRKGHRADIGKLISSGFTAQMDNWDFFDGFMDLYLSSMKRVGIPNSRATTAGCETAPPPGRTGTGGGKARPTRRTGPIP
jgi:hypothetical protein